MIQFGKASVEAAASAKAIQAQFEQVFGDVGGQAQKMIEGMGKEFGMLPNRLKPAFTTTTSMFKGLGLSTEEAMKQAEIAVTAAADAAAFYDKSYEEANSALNSFIKGNYEGGESIGLFANETQMASWAAENLGLDWKNLDEAGKQVARLEYAKAMQEAAGATGQASRESEGYENQVGNMKQAWQDFKTIVGEPILGVAIEGLQKATKWLQTAGEKVQELTNWAKENKDVMFVLGAVIAGVTGAIAAQAIINTVVKAYKAWKTATEGQTTAQVILNAIMNANPFGVVALAIGALITVGILLWKNWDTIKVKAIEIWNGIKNAISNAVNGVKNNVVNTFNSVKNRVVSIWNSIKDAISKPINEARDIVRKAIDRIKGIMNFKWELPKLKLPKINISGGFSLVPPKVPKFSIKWNADGAIFDRPTIFDTRAGLQGVGEAGPEAVTPINTLFDYIKAAVSESQEQGRLEEILLQILFELKEINSALYSTIVDALINGTRIDWNDRELARLVKNYA